MTQTSVKFVMDAGYPGTFASSNGSRVIRGSLLPYYNLSGGLIKFGRPVVKIAGQTNQVELPNDDTRTPIGIASYASFSIAGFPIDDDTQQGYPNEELMNIFTEGLDDIWVELEPGVTIAPGDVVYYRHTAPGSEEIGWFTNADSANHGLWSGVNFITPDLTLGTGAGQLKIAAINISDSAMV
jgi:hypothetical protein